MYFQFLVVASGFIRSSVAKNVFVRHPLEHSRFWHTPVTRESPVASASERTSPFRASSQKLRPPGFLPPGYMGGNRTLLAGRYAYTSFLVSSHYALFAIADNLPLPKNSALLCNEKACRSKSKHAPLRRRMNTSIESHPNC